VSGRLGIGAVIINYKTLDMTNRAVVSFRKYYPSVPLLLIDNGSNDESADALRSFSRRNPEAIHLIENKRNLHHGPAMDQAIRHMQSPFVFIMDSDCEVYNGGFLETMSAMMAGESAAYAIGKRVFMNKRGYDVSEERAVTPYIRPMFMLIDRDRYFSLPPFQHHGTPCLANMTAAHRRGFKLIDFPVEEYVRHDGRGTAGKYGYGLGWRGKLNHLFNKIGF
jgi:GT2 family glycosyltransferase